MLGFLRRRKRPDPDRELAHMAMQQADRALEERAAGLRAAMRELGMDVDKATVDLIDRLAAGFDASVQQMADDLSGGKDR